MVVGVRPARPHAARGRPAHDPVPRRGRRSQPRPHRPHRRRGLRSRLPGSLLRRVETTAMPYREYTHLDFDVPEPGILRIQFNNPKSLNSVSADQHTELARIWADIDRDPEVKVVIVTGAGDAFSSGGDFGLIEQMVDDFEGRILTMREARDIVYGVVNCSKPIVSAMTGPAVGAGLAVGLLADVSIATPSTKIVDGHTPLRVAPGEHRGLILPLPCGVAK